MKYEYNSTHMINYTDCDKTISLGLTNAVELAQDNVTEFFGTFNSDNVTTKNENNSVWVVVKSIMKFKRFPLWREKVKMKSYMSMVKAIRANVSTIAIDEKGNEVFAAKQEMCPIDVIERKIRKIETVNFPKDMDVGKEFIEEPFTKLKYNFEESEKVYSRKVLATDIDFSNHCNNVKYVNYIMDSMPSSFIDENKIDLFEIYYIKEVTEGKMLDIYRKEENGQIEFLIKDGDREINRALIKYSKR